MDIASSLVVVLTQTLLQKNKVNADNFNCTEIKQDSWYQVSHLIQYDADTIFTVHVFLWSIFEKSTWNAVFVEIPNNKYSK